MMDDQWLAKADADITEELAFEWGHEPTVASFDADVAESPWTMARAMVWAALDGERCGRLAERHREIGQDFVNELTLLRASIDCSRSRTHRFLRDTPEGGAPEP